MAIHTMQDGLEEVSLARILTVEEIEKLSTRRGRDRERECIWRESTYESYE